MSAGFEARARALADELVRRQEEDGLEGLTASDVGDAVKALGLKLRDITPPSDELSFYLDQMGATVLIRVTFKHGYLHSVGIFRELQMEYFS